MPRPSAVMARCVLRSDCPADTHTDWLRACGSQGLEMCLKGRYPPAPSLPLHLGTTTMSAVTTASGLPCARLWSPPRSGQALLQMWSLFQGAVGPLEKCLPPLFLHGLDLEKGAKNWLPGTIHSVGRSWLTVQRAGRLRISYVSIKDTKCFKMHGHKK